MFLFNLRFDKDIFKQVITQNRIQNPVKCLRWSFLRKQLTAESRVLAFDWVLNASVYCFLHQFLHQFCLQSILILNNATTTTTTTYYHALQYTTIMHNIQAFRWSTILQKQNNLSSVYFCQKILPFVYLETLRGWGYKPIFSYYIGKRSTHQTCSN